MRMAETAQTELEQKAKRSTRRYILTLAVVFTVVPTFLLFQGSHAWKIIDRFEWQKVPCEILSGGVERTAASRWYPYEPKIEYRYVLNGAVHESESVGESHWALYEEADAVVQRLLRSRNYCYVGGKPRQSVLFRFSPDHRFDLLYAGSFAAFAIILFFGQFIIRTVEGLRILRSVAFSWLFLFVAGVGLSLSVTMVKGIWKTSRAMKWPQVSCAIIVSDFQVDQSDGRMIYRPDILYQYRLKGRTFMSSRVDFFQEGVNKPDRALLAKYPEDSEALCYVNPADLAESVLAPKWSKAHLGFTAMGLFIAALAGGVLWLFVWPHKIKPQQFTPAPTETVLQSVRSHWSLLPFGVSFVLINSIIVLQFFVNTSVPAGWKWVPWAVMLGMNAFLLKTGWPWLKPVFLSKAILRLPQNHLVRGGTMTVAWELPENTKSFELNLFCVEWRSKTEAFTEIYNEPIFSGDNPEETGRIAFALPETAQKSVLEKDHVVEWAFKIRLNSGTWRRLENLYLVHVA
jgi:hypothetical protein